MNRNIDTIFFDVGATLRFVVEEESWGAGGACVISISHACLACEWRTRNLPRRRTRR